jgi:signal transduction histidine kinase
MEPEAAQQEPTSANTTAHSAGAIAPKPELDQALGETLRALMAAAQARRGSPLNPEQTARLLVERASQMLPATDCLIGFVPPDRQDHFRIIGGSGPWAASLIGTEFSTQGTIAGRAMQEGVTVETTHAQEESALREVLARGGIKTLRLVPITTVMRLPDGRTALGIFGFYRRSRTPFTPHERELIDEFAKLVSLALHGAELRQATAQAAKRLQTGVDVALDLAASLEPREVIRRLLLRAVEALDSDRATLFRLEGGEVVVEDSHDLHAPPAPPGTRYSIAVQPILQQAIATRKPVLSGAVNLSVLSTRDQQALADIRHRVAVPLLFGGEVAALLVLSRRQDLPFGVPDLATLQLIGNVAILALRNARVFSEVEAASRAKGDFLNLAAHELRTPLSVVAGYLSILQDGSLGAAPPTWRRPIDMLVEKTAELRDLVDDLLLASRLEAGSIPKAVQRIDLRLVVRDAVLRADPRARLLKASVTEELPGRPVSVDADPDHLGRILDNLINNALTYGGEQPWVRLAVSDGEPTQIAVQDHGPGIPAALQERIFERFFKIDDPSKPRQPGTGLGLFIARELARQNGGTVHLDCSEPGKGSTFVLRLPGAPRSASLKRVAAQD